MHQNRWNLKRKTILRNTIIACKIAYNASDLIQELINFVEMNPQKST